MLAMRHNTIALFFAALALLCLSGAGAAQAIHPHSLDYVRESQVADHAKVLHEKVFKKLLELADDTEYAIGVKMIVVTVPGLPKGWNADYYARYMGQQMGIGTGKHGVLMLFSKAEGKTGFTMTAGLERYLTPKLLGNIVKHEMQPDIDQKDYQQAVRNGAEGLSLAIQGKYLTPAEKRKQYMPFAILLPVVILLQVLFGNGAAARFFGGGAWRRW